MKKALLFLMTGCLALVYACSGQQDQRPAPGAGNGDDSQAPVTTEFVPVKEVRLPREIVTTGSLVAMETVTVSSEVEGKVNKIYHDVGDFVPKGAPLLELDRRELQLQLDRARASLEEALARIGASDPARLPVVEEVAEVRQAKALLEDAERKFQRAVELLERGVIPKAQMDEVKTQREVAAARYQSAVEGVRNQIASIRNFQALAALADKKLSDARISAPLSAYVDERLVSEGEYVRDNNPVFTLVQSHVLKLLAEVSEGHASVVGSGVPVLFTVDAFPGRDFQARIRRISPTVDQVSRTFRIEALVENPGNLLKPGFFARCRISAGERDALLVPDEALSVLAGVKKVFVKAGDRLEERLVETGAEHNGNIEIVKGVKSGEEVAVGRLADLSHGQRIR